MALAAHGHAFASLAEVMAKANEEKSGDRLAGLAAADARGARRGEGRARRRAAAHASSRSRCCRPSGDELTRAFLDALDADAYARLAGWTVGELREHLLADAPDVAGRAASRAPARDGRGGRRS